MKTKFAIISLMISGCFCALDISKFKLCKRNENDLNGCMKEAVQDGFIKLGQGIPSIPSIEPLMVPNMIIGEGATGAVKVVQNFTNVEFYGLSKQTIKGIKVNVDPNEFSLEMSVIIPALTMKAKYVINGRVLVLPVTGSGDCTIVLENLDSDVILQGQSMEKDGKVYIDIKHVRQMLRPKRVTYSFENLFNGDARLGEELNKVLNENWNVVFEDVKIGYEDSLGVVVQNLCNHIFHKVPYDVLFAT